MDRLKQRKRLYIGLGIVAVLLLYTFLTYNSFIKREEAVNKTWSDLQATYQRRFDMLPMLATVVKAAANFEQQTLVKLTEIRAQAQAVPTAVNKENYDKMEGIQADMANTTNSILAVVERYPDIKTQKNYRRMMDDVRGTERRIKVARQDFNEAVADYNKKVRGFPASLVAGIFGFGTKKGFSADAGNDNAPEIKIQ
jgi:LemA protein